MYDNLLEVQLINRNWARAPHMLFAEVQAVHTFSLLSASVLFISVIFYGQNIAGSSLRISAKCRSQKNILLVSRSFIIQFLSLLSG